MVQSGLGLIKRTQIWAFLQDSDSDSYGKEKFGLMCTLITLKIINNGSHITNQTEEL